MALPGALWSAGYPAAGAGCTCAVDCASPSNWCHQAGLPPLRRNVPHFGSRKLVLATAAIITGSKLELIQIRLVGSFSFSFHSDSSSPLNWRCSRTHASSSSCNSLHLLRQPTQIGPNLGRAAYLAGTRSERQGKESGEFQCHWRPLCDAIVAPALSRAI